MTQPISVDQPISTRVERDGGATRVFVDSAWFRFFVDLSTTDLAEDVTGVLPVANGGTGVGALPSWTPVTFTNAWADYGGLYDTCAFLKTWDGVVYLKGLMANGVVGSPSFFLPVGYRPSAYKIFAISSNATYGLIQIDTAGAVTVFVGNNTYASLEGISFRV